MKIFELTPAKKRAKLLAEAEHRLIEAEHMESRWKFAAQQAREEIARLTAQTGMQPVAISAEQKANLEAQRRAETDAIVGSIGRSFIGSKS